VTFELRDCTFAGAALPEPFVKFELEPLLQKLDLLPKATGSEGKALGEQWEVLRKKLRSLGDSGGPTRVQNHVLDPLVERLGYGPSRRESEVTTREGLEDGGVVFATADGKAQLRAWALDVGADFDAPSKRGHAYRYSPSQRAERVLLTKGERLGLITDGRELRLLLCDPARRQSHIAVGLDRAGGWRGARAVPDSYRLVLALASPAGLVKIADITDKARLTQTLVTNKLREQAKLAVTGFVQALLEDPQNVAILGGYLDKQALAQRLWNEALVVVYRLLFVFKLESSPDPARTFSFASTSLWRNTYSPNTALACVVDLFNKGEDTGRMLGDGLRALFRLFQEGLRSRELKVSPLGGMLFGPAATPLLDRLVWGESAAAELLDNLLWTPRAEATQKRPRKIERLERPLKEPTKTKQNQQRKVERLRVHYGSLDVEDLGRVYEALLELEPGIATEPMCRLGWQKLEVVVPLAQGAPYRASVAPADDESDAVEGDEAEEEGEDDKPARGKSRVLWIEEIKTGRYYLRVGLGRKATGSYYTPHAFVRFLVQETLGPQVAERSPAEDPQPGAILGLKVLDPAMGSGHFLVEACRFLGDKLYESCRLCDELASAAEQQGDGARAAVLQQRVIDLPDPNDELVAYLPSRVVEGEASGLSQAKAIALCRRLVAVHCLYGVDKNPLAVELAKLSLWLESYAEGLPLTFLDHRLICGDSLTGPFFEKLGTYPKSGEEVRDLFSQKLTDRLKETLGEALAHVKALEASIGKDVADIELKREAKEKLDRALGPFKVLAQAWSGGVMLGELGDDDAYRALMEAVAEKKNPAEVIGKSAALTRMIDSARSAISYDLEFPEVFYPEARARQRSSFCAIVGNPPWEGVQPDRREFCVNYMPAAFTASSKSLPAIHLRLLDSSSAARFAWEDAERAVFAEKAILSRLCAYLPSDSSDMGSGAVVEMALAFIDRSLAIASPITAMGLVLPGGFHANLSGTLLRQHLLDSHKLRLILGFKNNRSLFDISPGMRFDLVVAGGVNASLSYRFGMTDTEGLFPVVGALALRDEDRAKDLVENNFSIARI
jgi:hypothetical protein